MSIETALLADSGLSPLPVLTATAHTQHPFRGHIYDPARLAAGRLVHTHTTDGQNVLCLFSERWHSATPHATIPGRYTTHTAAQGLFGCWVNTAQARRVDISPRPESPLTLYAGARLIGATSRGSAVFALCHHKSGQALFGYTMAGSIIQFAFSKWLRPLRLPTGPIVRWNKGILASGNHIYLCGSDEDSRLYLFQIPLTRPHEAPLYGAGGGWSVAATDLMPLTLPRGDTPLTSHGPVSLTRHHDYWLLSTVSPQGQGRIYSARNPLTGLTPISERTLGEPSPLLGMFFQNAATVYTSPQDSAALPRIPLTYTHQTPGSLQTVWEDYSLPAAWKAHTLASPS